MGWLWMGRGAGRAYLCVHQPESLPLAHMEGVEHCGREGCLLVGLRGNH